MANESSGSVQDLMQSSGTYCPPPPPLPPALAQTGRLSSISPVPGPGLVACTMLQTQNGGWGQLQGGDPKSTATMLSQRRSWQTGSWPNTACCLLLQIKFYRNTATRICAQSTAAVTQQLSVNVSVVTETRWPTKPQRSTIWSFTRKTRKYMLTLGIGNGFQGGKGGKTGVF